MFGLNYYSDKRFPGIKGNLFYLIIAILSDNLVRQKRKHMVHNREVPSNQIQVK